MLFTFCPLPASFPVLAAGEGAEESTSYSGKMRRNRILPVQVRYEYDEAGLGLVLQIGPEDRVDGKVSPANLEKLTFEFFPPKKGSN